MLLVKTQAGLDSLKDRQGVLTQRQRSAFILFDGKRTAAQVLAATAAMGITQDDVQTMIDQGLLALPAGAAGSAPVAGAEASAQAPGTQGSERSAQERYREAYPIATELTADLGLRGFRLNLAIEGAGSFDDLAALAPKIREAVGDAKYARLEVALFG